MKIIVLSGGTGRRFGSDKSEAKINGKTLLELVSSDLGDLIIVGPESSIRAKYILENPPLGGPVAAIGAALKYVDTELVGIFAVDMPFATRLIPELLEKLTQDAALPIDEQGYLQPLAGIYKSQPLRSAFTTFESLSGQSMKSLIEKLHIDRVEVSNPDLLMDVDTKEDLQQAIDLHSKLYS